MNKKKLLLRISAFIVGLFVMSLGVALSVKADLGVSPISCIPYVYSIKLPFSIGELTIIFNILLIIMQIVLLRKKYRLIQLLQLPVVVLFGFFIDFSMFLLTDLHPFNYAWKMFWCFASIIVIAFGVFLEVKANITYLPGEGLAIAVADTFKKEFGKVKAGVDTSMVILGTISSFILLRHLQGIREGTIVAAILVGFVAKFFSKKLITLSDWLHADLSLKKYQEEPDSAVKENFIITISREYGSGGHEIAQHIADKLGISFYDKDLIMLTAEQSGYSIEYIQENEQKLASTLLFELYGQNYSYINEKQPPLDVLFLVQSKIIRDISSRESCIIVGRCANFVLKDTPSCFNVFIHAGKEYRKKRIADEYGVQSDMIIKKLERTDRERARHCLHYTGKNWNDVSNFHLTIDSSHYSSEESAELIIKATGHLTGKK